MLLCFPLRNTHSKFQAAVMILWGPSCHMQSFAWGKCERKCLLSRRQLQDNPLICTLLCFLHLSFLLRNGPCKSWGSIQKAQCNGDSNVLFMVACLMDERRRHAWILPVNLGFLCGMTKGTSHIKRKKTIIKSATTGASGWYSLELSLSSASKFEQSTQARGQH